MKAVKKVLIFAYAIYFELLFYISIKQLTQTV